MNTWRWVLCGVVLAAVASVARWRPADGQEGGREVALPRPVMSVHEVMDSFSKPVYKRLQQAAANQASRPQKWDELESQALQAAEVANLIAIRDWEPDVRARAGEHAAQVQQSAIELADAAKAKEPEQFRQAYEGLVQSCNSCHAELAPEIAPMLEP